MKLEELMALRKQIVQNTKDKQNQTKNKNRK